MTDSVRLSIVESSQAGEARRKAVALANSLGFKELEQGKVGIVVTELANNLLRHARDGMLLLRPIQKQDVVGIEILSLDKGPGISNISECLQDGFSTIGTSGNGLGAIERLSNLFDIYSVVGEGTAIVCHIWANSLPEKPSTDDLEIGVVCLPIEGEEVSGDGWTIGKIADRHLVLVADGLGHGPLAAQASQAAIRIFHEQLQQHPAQIIEAAHTAMRSTRGAALAIAEINLDRQTLSYAGVGNIAGTLFSSEHKASMVSHNGTVGHEVRKIQEFPYQWSPDGLLILHSDGLASQWRLERYLGLANFHPSLIAGILYRDHNRGRDDVTVIVIREAK